MIVEHLVVIRHEYDDVDNIEVLCMGEWTKFERKRTCRNLRPNVYFCVNGKEICTLQPSFECSGCGEFGATPYRAFNYCPYCGAKLVT